MHESTTAVTKALKSDAKWKYFQHAGALLTADGSDDHLIKLEGAPPGYKINIPKYKCKKYFDFLGRSLRYV